MLSSGERRSKTAYLKQYFHLTCKAALLNVASQITAILFLVLVTVLCCAGIAGYLYRVQIFKPVEISIVIPEGQEQVKLFSGIIESMDNVKSICKFSYDLPKQAKEKLEKQEVQAVITFPENFYEGVNDGTNTPAIITLSSTLPLKSGIFKELVQDGASLIGTAQAGIYAVTDEETLQKNAASKAEMEDRLTEIYLESAMQRGEIFAKEQVSAIGTATIAEYYASAAITILLLFSGMNYGFLFRKEAKTVTQKMRVYGIGCKEILAVRVFLMTLLTWIWAVLLYGAASVTGNWLPQIGFDFRIGTCLALFPVAFSMSCFFFLVYQAGRNAASSALFLFYGNALMILLSGCVLPVLYLPEQLQKIGACLPLAMWREYLMEILLHGGAGSSWSVPYEMALLFLVTGGVFCWKKD
jgi:hypothetical protein